MTAGTLVYHTEGTKAIYTHPQTIGQKIQRSVIKIYLEKLENAKISKIEIKQNKKRCFDLFIFFP